MRMIERNSDPSPRQLRQFGLISLVAVPLIGRLWVAPFAGQANTAVVTGISAAIGISICLLSLLKPRWIKLVFVGLSLITFPLGAVLSELVLLAVYCIVFAPMSLIFRLIRRDPLDRKIDRTKVTYWEVNPAADRPPETYLRQF